MGVGGDGVQHDVRELATLWSTVSRRHVSLGTACSCGMGGVTLHLQSYEQDIVDYVVADAQKLRRPDVLAFLEGNARKNEEADWSILLLLTMLEQNAKAEADNAGIRQFVLERLSRTLRSFSTNAWRCD
jgi:hypothetical protein